ncbi:hypothetical protein [Methyloterricola oryzae]|uniref:hypothetical protein n=1 Tax=Methyloterricola oryzae TaxID=1495050 RepID=UPI0005EB0361|nr:hypothetical protein [Methyloterricola oryzae]
MISVHPYLFFGLLDLAAVLLAACGFLLWKWRQQSNRLKLIDTHWAEARAAMEAAIAALHGAGNERRIASYRAMQHLFDPDPCTGSGAWKTCSNAVVALVSDLEAELKRASDELRRLSLEGDDEPKPGREGTARLGQDGMPSAHDEFERESWRGLGDMEKLVDDQHRQLRELARYRGAVSDLSERLGRVNLANQKLLEYLRSVCSDDRYRFLQQMVDKFQHGGQELDSVVLELEKEKQHLEPRIALLSEQNEHLQATLKQQRRQLERALQDKADLKATVDEQEKRIAMRNKSYDRLHKKFDALRREYLTLYELATKGGKSIRSSSGL